MFEALNNRAMVAKCTGRARMIDLCAESGILFRQAVNLPMFAVCARDLTAPDRQLATSVNSW
jgi:hypothetical protein